MTYGEVERLGITQHSHGVTVAMNHEQYALFREAIEEYRVYAIGHDYDVLTGMVLDIRERNIFNG